MRTIPIVVFSIALLATACTPALRTETPLEAELNDRLNCPVKASSTKSIKVDARDFRKIANSAQLLNTSQKLVAVFNRNCVNPGFFSKLAGLKQSQFQGKHSPYLDRILELPSDISIENLRKLAEEDQCLEALAPARKVELQSAPNDARYQELNHLKVIGHDQVWSKINSSLGITQPVVVAVIDSGATTAQPDLQGQWWSNSTEISGVEGVDDDGNGYVDDKNGFNFVARKPSPENFFGMPHSEHVSGIIAALNNNNEGVAGVGGNQMRIMNLMVLCAGAIHGCSSDGNPGDAITWMNEAIRYAADNGAHVINLSMGEDGSNLTSKQAIEYAVRKGSVVVAAAGNYSKDIAEQCFSPACYGPEIQGMLSVGAFDGAPNGGRARCAFSNYSNVFVEISAPGCDTTKGAIDSGLNGILSTERNDRYIHMPGTSMATPHIAGAAAIVIGYLRDRTGNQPSPQVVETILTQAALNAPALNDYVVQGRSLDLKKLVQYMDDTYVNPPPTSSTTTTTVPNNCP